MNDVTLFIADLHLNDKQPQIYQRFKEFINSKARDAKALYILGDLFEYYLGDDALTQVAQSVCKDLNELDSKYKTKCYFMPGNRDFLVASNFTKKAHLSLLEDPSTIQLSNQKIILSHGDALCTDDKAYQEIRLQLRSHTWQQWFLNQSIQDRIEFAQQARTKSQEYTQSVQSEIMDVNQHAVDELFNKFNTPFLLHGHTHRPAFHIIDNKQRMVVGDWHYQTSYIEHKNNNFRLIAY